MEPLASVAQLHLNVRPERNNFAIPKILADVKFGEIVIALWKNQVSFLFGLFTCVVIFVTFSCYVNIEYLNAENEMCCTIFVRLLASVG